MGENNIIKKGERPLGSLKPVKSCKANLEWANAQHDAPL